MTDLHEIPEMFARLAVPVLVRGTYLTLRGKGLPAPEVRLARWAEATARHRARRKSGKTPRPLPTRACHRTFRRIQ